MRSLGAERAPPFPDDVWCVGDHEFGTAIQRVKSPTHTGTHLPHTPYDIPVQRPAPRTFSRTVTESVLQANRWPGPGLFLACALIAACGGSGDGIGGASHEIPELDVQLREVLTLGADTSASSEYLFARPRLVATDSQGRIYVADAAYMNIRVYDASGRYIRTIGQRGRGPMEFQSFRALTVNDRDEVIVLDRTNARVTRFTPEGRELASRPTDIMARSQIRQFRAGYLIMNNNSTGGGGIEYLFRGYDTDFRETSVAFGSTDDFIDVEDRLEQMALFSEPGSFTFMEDRVVYAPSLYDGKLFVYEEEDGEWGQSRELQGHVEKTAYTRVTGGSIEATEVDALYLYAGKREGALLHNRSKGVFRLQDGQIVHFTFCEFGRERLWGVEVFDQSGNMFGYGVFDRIPLDSHGTTRFWVDVVWKDSRDRFYMIDRRGIPVIRVVELALSPDSDNTDL